MLLEAGVALLNGVVCASISLSLFSCAVVCSLSGDINSAFLAFLRGLVRCVVVICSGMFGVFNHCSRSFVSLKLDAWTCCNLPEIGFLIMYECLLFCFITINGTTSHRGSSLLALAWFFTKTRSPGEIISKLVSLLTLALFSNEDFFICFLVCLKTL